jgi:hypothetical protein
VGFTVTPFSVIISIARAAASGFYAEFGTGGDFAVFSNYLPGDNGD